jgi:hypothetical protein
MRKVKSQPPQVQASLKIGDTPYAAGGLKAISSTPRLALPELFAAPPHFPVSTSLKVLIALAAPGPTRACPAR